MRAVWLAALLLAGCDDAAEEAGPDASADAAPPQDADGTDAGPLPGNPDDRDVACTDPAWTPGACGEGASEVRDDHGGAHVPDPEAITYAESPPASGPHRGAWARWGEYDFLPPQRWLHNLEHGGAAFLYHPCADAALVDALRTYAQARPADDGGAFRWVLTPYPDLPSTFAVVTWRTVYTAECVQPAELDDFLDRTYRRAPEDIAGDGSYDKGRRGP